MQRVVSVADVHQHLLGFDFVYKGTEIQMLMQGEFKKGL